MDKRETYQVNLDAVLGCHMDDIAYEAVFGEFNEAKRHALDAFQVVIDRLTGLCEEIREATDYEDLDLGWWEPLFEKIEQPAETIPSLTGYLISADESCHSSKQ